MVLVFLDVFPIRKEVFALLHHWVYTKYTTSIFDDFSKRFQKPTDHHRTIFMLHRLKLNPFNFDFIYSRFQVTESVHNQKNRYLVFTIFIGDWFVETQSMLHIVQVPLRARLQQYYQHFIQRRSPIPQPSRKHAGRTVHLTKAADIFRSKRYHRGSCNILNCTSRTLLVDNLICSRR